MAKENAAELPPKLKILAAIFCPPPRRFVKIARADICAFIIRHLFMQTAISLECLKDPERVTQEVMKF